MSAEGLQSAAVLTGDIVGSRKGTDLSFLGTALRDAAKSAAGVFPGAGVSTIDLFRGDSWQVLVKERERALRVALFIRTYLLGGEAREGPSWDTRIGIGVGPVDWVDEQRISQSRGPAFVASGHALDSLADSRRNLALRSGGSGEKEVAGQAVAALLDAVVQRWTAKQAWAINGALRDNWTQARIGESFVPPLQQRTVADHLKRADWEAVEGALRWWKEAFA